MTTYLALLRGINVGGNNKIAMADLKACFEKNGFTNVATYIQSGNVLFDASGGDIEKLTKKVESMLTSKFAPYEAKVVLRSHEQLKAVIASAPKGFGTKPKEYRYYVIFLKSPLTSAAALKDIPIKEGVDHAWAGAEGVLFHERVEARATQSHLNKLVAMPMYQNMTIRNWNTTTKMLAMMETPKTSN